jgi:hypothetical protein
MARLRQMKDKDRKSLGAYNWEIIWRESGPARRSCKPDIVHIAERAKSLDDCRRIPGEALVQQSFKLG